MTSTWRKDFDLPPGDYTLRFASYTPPMERVATVRPHSAVPVKASGYGRIVFGVNDGRGPSLPIAVHVAGRKEALLGTWKPYVDLPPGRYDLRYGSGDEAPWIRGVVVKPHAATSPPR